jgi:3-hydroxyacyl-[acyl-carrier-protein] dehydratase
MTRDLIVDPDWLDFDRPVATLDEIRQVNRHRHEMEQLTAILSIDPASQVIAGYKDVRLNEFWVRGHMPGAPVMPVMLMCEAAAQLCSYYISVERLFDGEFGAITALQNFRFLLPVLPGHRLVVAARAIQVRRNRQAAFATQGIVQGRLAFEGDLFGAPFFERPRERVVPNVFAPTS